MEGTDIRHIKRMNHPRASCSRRGVADHKHETWCKQCFGRHQSRGSRGWTLCKTPRRRQRLAQREKRLHPWTFSADLPCIDVLMSLRDAWVLAANIINSVKATNWRAIDGSANDWEDKQMHSCRVHKMAALSLKALFYNNWVIIMEAMLETSSLSVGHSQRHVGGPTNWDLA